MITHYKCLFRTLSHKWLWTHSHQLRYILYPRPVFLFHNKEDKLNQCYRQTISRSSTGVAM